MSELYTVRRPDGREFAPDYWTGSDPLYSTVELSSGAVPVLKAFSYGMGGAVPGSPTRRKSTLADTNLVGPGGKMPKNNSILVYSINVEAFLIGADDNDSPAPLVSLQTMMAMQRDLVLSFWVGATTLVAQGPLGWFPGASGVVGPSAFQTNDAGAFGFNGSTSRNGARNLAVPVFVDQGETFDVRFEPGPGQVVAMGLDDESPASRIRLRTHLVGLRHGPTS